MHKNAAVRTRCLMLATMLSGVTFTLPIVSSVCAQDLYLEYSSIKLEGSMPHGTKHVPFEIEVSCTPARMLRQATIAGVRYGTDGYDPKCVLTRLTLKLNRKRVHIPKASFEDLADVTFPASVGIDSDGETDIVLISGGDGSASYKARFFVRGGRLVAREVDGFDEDGEIKTTREEYQPSSKKP